MRAVEEQEAFCIFEYFAFCIFEYFAFCIFEYFAYFVYLRTALRAVEEQEARLERAASIVARERSLVLFAIFFGGLFLPSLFLAAGSLGVVVFVLVYRAQRVPDTPPVTPLPFFDDPPHQV